MHHERRGVRAIEVQTLLIRKAEAMIYVNAASEKLFNGWWLIIKCIHLIDALYIRDAASTTKVHQILALNI